MSERLTKKQLEALTSAQLRQLAKEAGLKNVLKMRKAELVSALATAEPEADHPRRVVAKFESLPVTMDLASERVRDAAAHESSFSGGPFNSSGRPPARANATLDEHAATASRREEGMNRRPLKEEMLRARVAKIRGEAHIPDAASQTATVSPARAGAGREGLEARQRDYRAGKRRDRGADSREQPTVQNDLEQSYFQKGVLDVTSDSNYGFIRQRAFRMGSDDIYISMSQIKKFSLRTGDVVSGHVRPPRDGERYPSMVKIEAVNDRPSDESKKRIAFESLTPVYPDTRLFLESDPADASTRLIDLFAPVGLGTRGIIVAKPKAGKTIMLKKIASSIAQNHPDVDLIAALIDERPEEVTDFQRTIKGEVISSTFDEKPEHHIQVAEMVIEYAKRKVEMGRDVMILLDSLTRMARAHNLTCPPSGKTLSGGLDPNSLYKPKSFLGAARNMEHGGSLTILATALIETGSRLDDIIFEEFKGTANMELHLSRELADQRIFPAIDIMKSGTRHEELLYNADEMDVVWRLRRMVADMDEADRMNRLITKMLQTKTNLELLFQVRKATE
ncbi:MAG: transcription termination factor Rho [Candidatus Riflebacteria bacterium RBG_13_59_9]|nr:MAG: transcription termination factor Rho [Candidatus Riflebacteria bacterium RBG_13_59_9]